MEEKRIEELQKRYVFSVVIKNNEKGLMPNCHIAELKKSPKIINEIKENKPEIIAWLENREQKRIEEKEKRKEEKKEKDAALVQSLKNQGKLIYYYQRIVGDYSHEAHLGTGYRSPEESQNYKEEYRENILFGNSATAYTAVKHVAEADIKNTIRTFSIGNEIYHILPEEEYKRLILLEKNRIQQKTDAIKEKKEKKEKEKEAIFQKAKDTQQEQLLEKCIVDCDDPHEECSTDIICTYAMPDGTIKIIRNHTW